MATRFACDPEQARQVAERLVRVADSFATSPPSDLRHGRIGFGALEAALADFDTAVSAAVRNLGGAINESSTNFSALARGAVDLDQQEQQEAEGI